MRVVSLLAVSLLNACGPPPPSEVPIPTSDGTPAKAAWTVRDVTSGRVRIVAAGTPDAVLAGRAGEVFDVQLIGEDPQGLKALSVEVHRRSSCVDGDIASAAQTLVTPKEARYPATGATKVPTSATLGALVTLDHTCASGVPHDQRRLVGAVENFGSVTAAPSVTIRLCRPSRTGGVLEALDCPHECKTSDECPSCSGCEAGKCVNQCITKPVLKYPDAGI